VSEHYDVAVVGAGLIGCAAAHYLSRTGRRVVVLDQSEINRGASGRNAGSLHFQIEPRMVDVLLSDPQKLAELIPVNLQAIEDWQRVASELRCDLEIVMQGGLMIAETEAEHELLLRKNALEVQAGLTVRIVDRAELSRLAPYLSEQVRFASFCPQEGHANPRLIAPAFAASARANGAVFRLNARVRTLQPSMTGWRIFSHATDASDIDIEAEAVLIAAGAWSTEILKPVGFHVPLTAVGLQMMVTQRTAPLMNHLVQHMGRRLSMKQLEAGNILIGGGWPARLHDVEELGEIADAQLHERAMIGSAAVAALCVPATRQLSIIRSWSGIACIAPDHLPVLGAVDSLPGIFIAAGGSSFTLGPTYARLISELMSSGRASMPIGLYHPERFGHALNTGPR
jgi:glycine/D-amino acid oxidase-like deaminating enzyme